MCFLLFWILTFPPLQQAIEAVQLSWAFRENCLSVCVFQRERVFSRHDNCAVSMGTPVRFTGAQLVWRHSFGYFSVAVDRKVTRQRGETRNAKVRALS